MRSADSGHYQAGNFRLAEKYVLLADNTHKFANKFARMKMHCDLSYMRGTSICKLADTAMGL